MTDAEGLTTTYSYDALGRVIAETKSGGGVRPDTVTTMTYDSDWIKRDKTLLYNA